MNGGNGFTSFGALAATANETATFNNPARLYSWTNGTPTASGNSSALNAERLNFNALNEGARLTLGVGAAGTYQMVFYSTVFDLKVTGTATLTNGGVTNSFANTTGSGLQDNVWTVDFVTDGADTLTFDMTRNSSVIGSTFAFEAFTLIPEPTSCALIAVSSLALLVRKRRA